MKTTGKLFTSLLITLFAVTSIFAERTKFSTYAEFTNNTDDTIFYLYVSHSEDSLWGEDILGDEVLPAGETFTIELEDCPNAIFDIRAEHINGDDFQFYGVDVRESFTITNESGDFEVTKAGDYGFSGYIDVTNSTGYDIFYLHVSHTDSDEWEEDVLGSDQILEDGETVRVNLAGFHSSIFDVHAQDEDGDTYTFFSIDVMYDDLTITLDDLD